MTLNGNWQRQSGEERTEDYRTWRTTAGLAGVCDIDQIEYRFVSGQLKPVALIELCVADMMDDDHPGGVRPGGSPSPAFLQACIDKLDGKRPQGTALRLAASAMSVPVLLVVYIRQHLEDMGVWVFRLFPQGSGQWRHMSLVEYLHNLGKLT